MRPLCKRMGYGGQGRAHHGLKERRLVAERNVRAGAPRKTCTQQGVVEVARQIAQNQGSEVVIHRRDGTIRDKDSYGKDAHPPKDTKH